MSLRDRKMRTLLKRVLVPVLHEAGFRGRYPDFRRKVRGELHLLCVMHDTHGGGFFIEVANRAAGDMAMPWGETVAEEAICVAHTDMGQRARLQGSDSNNSLREDWFRYERLDDAQMEALANHVVQLLPQVEDWLRDRTIGNNIASTEP